MINQVNMGTYQALKTLTIHKEEPTLFTKKELQSGQTTFIIWKNSA
jgi:hypothetical protein